MQKLPVAVKEVYRDVLLVPVELRLCQVDYTSAEQNDYRTILIVVVNLLIDCSNFLQSDQAYPNAKEYSKLLQCIGEAVPGICASYAHLLSEEAASTKSFFQPPNPSLTFDIDALRAL